MKSKKEITACINPKGLPLYGYEDGQHIGILPEIMFLLEKRIPVPFRYVPVKTWEECVALSKAKKVDISGMIITSPNRHTHLTASKKILEGSIGIATKMQEPLLQDLTEMNNKKVALFKGQVSVNAFIKHKFPDINIVMVDSIEEGLEMVAKGKIYGYADDTYSLAYYILKLHSNELKILERINENPVSVSVGILKDELELINVMNRVIDSIDEQQIKDITHDWISVRVEKGFDYTLLVKIASVFLLILLVSFYWVRKLTREVAKRRKVQDELNVLNENLASEISTKIQEIHYKDAMLTEKTKLAAMGEMIGAIAHQWRRPLSTLHINLETLEDDYDEGKIDKAFMKQHIEENSVIIQYMSKTIDDFQNFYNIDKEKVLFDVTAKIASTLALQFNLLEKNDIKIIKEGKSFTVYGHPSEFQQVILNIISNAKDALLEKKVKEPYIKIKVFSNDVEGSIAISDNAEGIEAEKLPKVFEPYFTTKDDKGGTGLGLYISKMIIEKNMHGHLSISNKDLGSEVLITLEKEKDV
ncbi:ATP-binding protein [Sulfurovum sp.]|uniref:ATP-binding protein n=1 Tax=Sulfurovum sp. TaxID=1969726 RepID=UPI002867ECD3|nr:transporter substrate-binding domain-containing protein [Sulfurovum sp.]